MSRYKPFSGADGVQASARLTIMHPSGGERRWLSGRATNRENPSQSMLPLFQKPVLLWAGRDAWPLNR